MVEVTPAEAALLRTVKDMHPKQLRNALKHIKEFMLYSADELHKTDLTRCYEVSELQKSLNKIAKEYKRKTEVV